MVAVPKYCGSRLERGVTPDIQMSKILQTPSPPPPQHPHYPLNRRPQRTHLLFHIRRRKHSAAAYIRRLPRPCRYNLSDSGCEIDCSCDGIEVCTEGFGGAETLAGLGVCKYVCIYTLG